MKNIICKLFGHKDIRVITTVFVYDENGKLDVVIGDDSDRNRIFINSDQVYVDKNNRCSRCFKIIE